MAALRSADAGIDRVVDQAIDWMVLQQSGRMTPAQQQALDAWLAQAPAHRAAWQQLGMRLEGFAQVRGLDARYPGQARDARETLLDPRRRTALRSLVGLAVMSAAGGLAWADRQTPLSTLTADMRTATARRARYALPDGSTLMLNARSAVDVAFSASHRQLRLRQGAAVVEAAGDTSRPLLISALQGWIRVLAGHVLAQMEGDALLLGALDTPATVGTPAGLHQALAPGQVLRVSAGRLLPAGEDAASLADWRHGRLTVLDQPLATMIARLRPYRSGLLRISPAAGQLRVQGVFPLDDSERALQALAETLPVRLHRYGPVVLVEHA